MVASRSFFRVPIGARAAPRRAPPLAASGVSGIDLGLAALYRDAPAPGPPLRVGVLLDGPRTIRCFRHALEDVVQSNCATLAAVVYNADESTATGRARTRAGRWLAALTNARTRRHLAYSLYG